MMMKIVVDEDQATFDKWMAEQKQFTAPAEEQKATEDNKSLETETAVTASLDK